jgi:hypothetical protein
MALNVIAEVLLYAQAEYARVSALPADDPRTWADAARTADEIVIARDASSIAGGAQDTADAVAVDVIIDDLRAIDLSPTMATEITELVTHRRDRQRDPSGYRAQYPWHPQHKFEGYAAAWTEANKKVPPDERLLAKLKFLRDEWARMT